MRGLLSSRSRNDAWSIPISSARVIAVTVADGGPPSSNDTSPMISPGPSSRIVT